MRFVQLLVATQAPGCVDVLHRHLFVEVSLVVSLFKWPRLKRTSACFTIVYFMPVIVSSMQTLVDKVFSLREKCRGTSRHGCLDALGNQFRFGGA